MKPDVTTSEAVRFLLTVYPEYKGMMYFCLEDLARIYFRGNQKKMRAFLAENNIPPYFGDTSHKRYNILEVQQAVGATKWKCERTGDTA